MTIKQYCRDHCYYLLNKNNNKMIEQSKSPKSLAYARLGKPASGKTSLQEEHKKPNRNSTGNIYEEILQQFHPKDNTYIRQLVAKNGRETDEEKPSDNFHSRKKSYAEIVIDNGTKEKKNTQKTREERETLSRSKQPADNFLMQAATPKNSTIPINNRGSARNCSINHSSNSLIASFKKEPIRNEGNFLDNLNNYLEELTQVPDNHPKAVFSNVEKLSETLKINSNEGESFKLASKLEQCQMKIKELKLKNYYQDKQLAKNDKKQKKMKESLFQMLGEIKQLNAQLTYERRERKKLEKIIDNFDIKHHKPERKTIGKLHNVNLDEFENENTENEFERDCEDSFRDFMKRSLEKKANTSKLYGGKRNGGLDSQKIEKLFRSNDNSEDSDD